MSTANRARAGSARRLGVGLIGTDHIAGDYGRFIARDEGLELVACASRSLERATSLAAELGCRAVGVDDLLGDQRIDIVVLLTPAATHLELGLRALKAGRHLYCEKPLATSLAEAELLVTAARERGLKIGCAPDTFYGAALQTARAAIDDGLIGRPVGGAVAFRSHGMEHWHPNPAHFYQPGSGPILDMGPYYLTHIVALLGPVQSVICSSTRPTSSRSGRTAIIPVEIDTSYAGVLRLVNGADISFTVSWDIWRHDQPPIEIYGTEGSLSLPDPNFFAGDVRLSHRGGSWETLDPGDRPYQVPNMVDFSGRSVANYRGAGVADLACSIRNNTEPRASADLGLHILAVAEALAEAAKTDRRIVIRSGTQRPPGLT